MFTEVGNMKTSHILYWVSLTWGWEAVLAMMAHICPP